MYMQPREEASVLDHVDGAGGQLRQHLGDDASDHLLGGGIAQVRLCKRQKQVLSRE